MLLSELVTEGALKRSDPYISGEDELPAKPRLYKKSAFQARVDSLAKAAGVTPDRVRELWVAHSGRVDPKNMNRWAIITRRVKDDLGLS